MFKFETKTKNICAKLSGPRCCSKCL